MHRQFGTIPLDFYPLSADLQTAPTNRPVGRPLTYAFDHQPTYETANLHHKSAIQRPTSHHPLTYA